MAKSFVDVTAFLRCPVNNNNKPMSDLEEHF